MYNETQHDAMMEELATVEIDGLDWVGKQLVEVKVKPRAFSHGDGVIQVSAEEGDGFASYYGPKGWPEIHPALEAFASKHGCFWEWKDPGSIALYTI